MIESMPKISVIMLTYNREQLVSRAIESILAQTFQDFEFIIVLNGCIDGSKAIVEEYAEKDSRIHIICKEKGNIGSGRNAGLDAAVGEYIAFIDDDDWCEPDFLEFLYNLAQDHQADIAVCGSYIEQEGIIGPNGRYCYNELHLMNTEEASEAYLHRIYYNAGMPTKLIHRRLFEKIRFSDKGNYDDITTTYRYFVNAEIVVAQGLPLYVVYRHPGNHSSTATKHYMLNSEQLFEYLAAFRERTRYISEILPQLSALAKYSEWSYMISMVEKIYRYHLDNCTEALEFIQNELQVHWKEFYEGNYIEEFEKEWMNTYIK